LLQQSTSQHWHRKQDKEERAGTSRNKDEANFEEPKITWKKSDVKWLLYKEIMGGLVLLEAKFDKWAINNANM
jgi:hypothetical protein